MIQPSKDQQHAQLLPRCGRGRLFDRSARYGATGKSQGDTPAVNAPNTPPNPGAPVPGANSFTEGQAKSRIESNGFSNVTELRKDDQGVWRGKAMKDGRTVAVSLDFQGNVTSQ